MFLKKRNLLSAVLILFFCVCAYAQEITFSANVDKNKIALNEYLVYSLTVSGEDSSLPEPKLDSIENFTVYGSGRSQKISFVNGKRSGSLTISYTLAPKKIGVFTIPPAKINYKNQTYQTDSVEVEIVEAAKIQSVSVSRPAASGSANKSADMRNTVNAKVFVKSAVNKKTVYVNEKLIYTFRFYTNIDLVSNPEYYAPDFGGFWKDSSAPKTRYETIDGINYQVNEIETSLYPIEKGKVTISPAKLRIAFLDFSSSNSGDFFGMFMNMGQRREKILESDEITINILPLPQENKPSDFNGAIGNFKISAFADTYEAKTGEPLTVTVKVSGKGNMKSVTDINFDAGKDFKVYDTVSSKISDDSREFQILMIPLTPGEKIVNPIKICFFNPDKKEYSYAQSEPIKIKVEGEIIAQKNSLYSSAANDENIKNDIRYNIKPDGLMHYYDGYLINSPIFWSVFAFIFFILLGILLFRFYKERKHSDPLFVLKMRARALSDKSLYRAQKEISAIKDDTFYDNLYQSILSAATAVCGTPQEKLSSSEIASNLISCGKGEECAKNVREVLDRVNFYRFASVPSDEKAKEALFNKAKEVIDILREE